MFSRIYATKSLSQPAQNLNIFSQVLAKGKLNINIATLIPNDLILELIFSIERSNLARTIKKYRKFCEICTKYIFCREMVDNNCAMCYD